MNVNKTMEEARLIIKYNKLYHNYGFREGSGFDYSKYNRYTPRLYNFMKEADYINGKVKREDKEKLFEKFLFHNELTSHDERLEYIQFLKLKYGDDYDFSIILD